jgi:cytochrome b561
MKTIKNSKENYGIIAISFHWIMAILIISIIAVGFYMSSMENSPDKFKFYGLHKSFGGLILGLVIFRLSWKLVNTAPELPLNMKSWEKIAAKSGHLALYFFMFAMPLSGWLMSSAAGFPVSFFGLFTLPNLVGPDNELRRFFGEAHEIMAFALIGVIAVHFMAALQHHFLKKDTVLTRMLP